MQSILVTEVTLEGDFSEIIAIVTTILSYIKMGSWTSGSLP